MISKRAILPSSSDIIAPAIAELVSRRPRAFDAVNLGRGRYAHIFAGLQAQAELAIARLADGVVGNTRTLAKGDQLKAFVASESELPNDLSADTAVGSCVFDRTASTDLKLAGVIRKGQKLLRVPAPDATVPLVAADYQVSADTPVALNQNVVTVPIEATRAGSSFNTPLVIGVTNENLTVVDQLFDRKFLPISYSIGGGGDGFDDSDILEYAATFDVGQFGPNDDALKLAALRVGGVRHILLVGKTMYVADRSWGASERWLAVVKQSMLNDEALGYAIRFDVAAIPSYPVQVALTVRLRDTAYLTETSELDLLIARTVRSYFDDRDDFNVINQNILRAVVTKSDTKVLRCTDTTLTNLDGTPFTLPTIGHAYLAHSAVNITYLPPV